MYFCCIRKIFKRFCKCIQYVCLDTFENLAKKKFLIFFWNINSLKNDKKMLFETLTFWKMNFRWSWLSTFPLTSYFYFNVQKAIFKREFKSTSQGSTITFQCPSQNHLSLKRFFVAKLRKKSVGQTICLIVASVASNPWTFFWILLKSKIWLHKRHLATVQEYAKFHSVWKSPKISHFKLIF